jgi:hypothetical protein
MAFFSQEEEKTRLNEYTIVQYVHKENSTAREIISFYETTNNSAYHHYASEWRYLDLNMSDKAYKERIFDSICAAVIDDNATIHNMCKSDLEKLSIRTKDLNFSEVESMEDNIDYEEFQEFSFNLKMIYSDFWPSNAVRLKAYSDKTSSFYKDGKLSNFEYYLRSIYRQKILSGEYGVQIATSGYQRDISIYRDTYFESINTDLSNVSFYLQVLEQLDNFNYELADDIIFQATEDASSGDPEVNYNFFISFQAYFNKMISKYALSIKESTYLLSASEIKHIMQSAKLNEMEYENRYSELFNLYISTYKQTYRQYAQLTSMVYQDVKLPDVEEYNLNTFLKDVEDTFEDTLHTSMHEMVNQSVAYYEKTDSDDYILSTEGQIRNYYQEQLSKLYLKPKNEIKLTEIQKLEVPVLEEYKEKIDEFRNACMRKISYSFASDYPPINKFENYSFNIDISFQGLDKRTVVEWAMQAAKKKDLSLHSINLIRLKISEFININCMNGDNAAHKEELGSHELSVIQEKYAMIEHRIRVFGESLTEVYLQYLKRYYTGDFSTDEWKVFESKVDELHAQPLTTYYDTSFDIASVQKQASEDNDNYDLGSETPFFTKMKTIAQKKIFDLNDMYANEVAQAKDEYIKTGRKVGLNLIINTLRVDIDRIVDEHMNLANYYVKEFEEQSIEVKDEFEKGPHYFFQSDNNIRVQS